MSYTVERLGARPSLPDYRDRAFLFERTLAGELMNYEDLPPESHPQARQVDKVPVVDQGRTGSCVGEASAFVAAVQRNVTQRSGSFVYYECRRMIGETNQDAGAYGVDGCKVVSTLGVPRHSLWPTELGPDGHQLRVFEDPNEKADVDALKRKLFTYHHFGPNREHEFRSCLTRHLLLGSITVFSNMWDPRVDRFGIIPRPAGSFQGGHRLAFTGYYDDFRSSEWAAHARREGCPESFIPKRAYKGRNSWGIEWGRGGNFVIDADFLEDHEMAWDFQTLRGYEDERRT